MRTSKTSNIIQKALAFLIVGVIALGAIGANPTTQPTTRKTPKVKKPVPLRDIRVAVFDMEVLEGLKAQPGALTDQINVVLDALPKVTIVNRTEIKKVAAEHKMALTGLVDLSSAVKMGKFLNAQYIVVGRASKIGSNYYLVIKIVDVETTVQTTVSAKSPAEGGAEALLKRLSPALRKRVRGLQKPVVTPEDKALMKLRKAAEPLAGAVVLVHVTETHINRPLKDPAAQMGVANRLRSLGFEVVMVTDPQIGWKGRLLKSGKYGRDRIDYLLEGEAVSAHAAEIHNLISCRARAELRLITLPGRTITVVEKGVAAKVDLVEALAAKAALEEAGIQATDAVVMRLVKLKADQAKKDKEKDKGGKDAKDKKNKKE